MSLLRCSSKLLFRPCFQKHLDIRNQILYLISYFKISKYSQDQVQDESMLELGMLKFLNQDVLQKDFSVCTMDITGPQAPVQVSDSRSMFRGVRTGQVAVILLSGAPFISLCRGPVLIMIQRKFLRFTCQILYLMS